MGVSMTARGAFPRAVAAYRFFRSPGRSMSSQSIGLSAVLVSLAFLLGTPGCKPPAPTDTSTNPGPDAPDSSLNWFEDVTNAVGLTFTHECGPTGKFFMPQAVHGGGAFFDADGDGRLDILLLQGAGPNTGVCNRLYLQTADGKFRDVSAGSGLDFDGYNMGVAIGDVDNDGRPDVLVTQYTGARLLRNEGGGKFRDITKAAGIENLQWGTSAAFVDYDRDGRLDLIVINYIDYDPSWPCTSPDGSRDFCGPRSFPGTIPRLFHNIGPGDAQPVRFVDVTVQAGLATKPAPGLGIYAVDLTGDGWPDLLIANDGTPNHFWVNQKDGTFKNEAMSRGIALTGNGQPMANMGIAVGDYDMDGLTDIFITHLGTETHTLWRQSPVGFFRDRTQDTGVTKTKWRGTGFGAVGADFDLDGWVDIAFVNGKVYRGAAPPGANHLPEFWRVYAERNQLLRNAGGGKSNAGGAKFDDISEANPAFCGTPNVARGLAIGDFDNDGRPDLLVTSISDRARLYRNVTTSGHWLGIRAIDPKLSGRDAYGTTVRVTAAWRNLVQVVQPAHSYLCSSDPRLLFGLGDAKTIDRIDVTWPDGTKESWRGGPTDRWVELRKGEGSGQ
jgi:enediyne biosynthesis protein E4